MISNLFILNVLLILTIQSAAQLFSLDNEYSEEFWEKNDVLIDEMDGSKPNFLTKGVRVSEAKCSEYIWEIQQEERIGNLRNEYMTNTNFVGITGGSDVAPGTYPHMAAVGWPGKKRQWEFLCAGFLVSDKFLLTAAHCRKAPIDGNRVTKAFPEIVRLGVDNIYADQRAPQDVEIDKFISHPKYKTKYSDIALIRLVKAVTFNKFVRPACIRNEEASTAIITGWGEIRKGRSLGSKHTVNHLKEARVDIIERETCEYMLKERINKQWSGVYNQICAVDQTTAADTCDGDSGSPLVVELQTNTQTKVYNAIGVTSFGFTCGNAKVPSIYSNVSSFLDWIEPIVWRDEILNMRN